MTSFLGSQELIIERTYFVCPMPTMCLWQCAVGGLEAHRPPCVEGNEAQTRPSEPESAPTAAAPLPRRPNMIGKDRLVDLTANRDA